jgi:two-component system, OmpR family, phosphate regulon response regulator PhoB
MRILVVDDDMFFVSQISEILCGAGHEVIAVGSGKEAIAQAVFKVPDLIILDMILPGLLGTEVCEKLRSLQKTAAVPIILVSSGVAEMEVTGRDPEQFLADDFLPKPFGAEELINRVNLLAGKTSKFAEKRSEPACPDVDMSDEDDSSNSEDPDDTDEDISDEQDED